MTDTSTDTTTFSDAAAPARFGVIGGGWRTDFFLRVARELPDRFQCLGVVVRDPQKGEAFTAKWGVPTFRTPDEMLGATTPEFVIVSVPWEPSPGVLLELAERGIPALGETPPAPDAARLAQLYEAVANGAKINVAEQYIYQPLHAARIALARSGKLGTVTQAQVSAAHGYHGISLIRHLLGVRFEKVTVTARRFTSPLVASPDRNGPPKEDRVTNSGQVIAQFDFETADGPKLGVYDFTGDQYFSWVRGPRVLVRGERGEIENETLRYLRDYRTPVTLPLVRQDAGHRGNLEGYHHVGYLAGAEWVYRNPYAPGRLADDEIAVATILEGMARHARGGPAVYSLADAAHDRYLDTLMEQALKTGQPVTSEPQPWATA